MALVRVAATGTYYFQHPRTVNRLILTAITWSLTATFSPADAAPQTPNIIFILADDMGYGDCSVQATAVFD